MASTSSFSSESLSLGIFKECYLHGNQSANIEDKGGKDTTKEGRGSSFKSSAQRQCKGRKQAHREAAANVVAKAAPPVTVTLKHFAVDLAERLTLPKKDAEAILVDFFDRVVDHLKAGERVRIAGLGIIEVKDRAARMGRNPATGEAIQIKASKNIAFRVAKELKAVI